MIITIYSRQKVRSEIVTLSSARPIMTCHTQIGEQLTTEETKVNLDSNVSYRADDRNKRFNNPHNSVNHHLGQLS